MNNTFLKKVTKLSHRQKKIKLTDKEIKMAVDSLSIEDTRLRFWIGNLILYQGQRSVPVLLEGTQSKNPEIRRSSVYLLGKLAKKEGMVSISIIDTLRKALFDEDPKVRKNSAIMLGKLEIKEAVNDIISALQKETIEWVKPSMILALGVAGGEKVKNYLSSYQAKNEMEEDALRKALDRVCKLHSNLQLVKNLPYPILIELRTIEGLESVLEQELYEKLGLKSKKIKKGVLYIQSNNLYNLFTIRTFSEILIPIMTTEIYNIEEVSEKIIKYIVDNNILTQILSFYQGDTSKMRYRIEISSPNIKHYIRQKIIKEISKEIDKFSSIFVNSPSNYNIEFRIIIERNRILRFLWKPFTKQDIRFNYRIKDVPASINPVVAAGILRLFKMKLELSGHAHVLDPFCGSGTILIERAILGKCKELIGVDISQRAIEAAKQNIKASKFTNIKLINKDIRNISRSKKFDEIITNMPFGIRIGNHKKNEILYMDFFNLIPDILKKGGAIMLYTQEINLVTKLFNENPNLKLLEIHRVEVGGLRPAVFIGYMV